MKKTISVVAVVRNDNYGLHLEDRLIGFFNSIRECIYNIELVLVEWNPPTDRKSFYEEFYHIIPNNKKLKIITVLNDTHKKIEHNQYFNVFEYWAKNVGARNASNDYVLFTNPDNIFTKELWDELFLNLSPEHFIRAVRADFFYQKLDYKNLTVSEIVNTLPIMAIHNHSVPNERFFGNAAGDFLCTSKESVFKIKGYDEYSTFSHIDAMILDKLGNTGLNQKLFNNYTYHIDHYRPNNNTADIYNLYTVDINGYVYKDDWGLLNENIIIKNYN
jgi:hypothetical protein